MLLQTPWPIVHELHDSNPPRQLALATLFSPSGFKSVASGQEIGPSVADEVRNEHDESSLNRDIGGFELWIMLSAMPWIMYGLKIPSKFDS